MMPGTSRHRGRPLYFIGLILLLWATGRSLLLPASWLERNTTPPAYANHAYPRTIPRTVSTTGFFHPMPVTATPVPPQTSAPPTHILLPSLRLPLVKPINASFQPASPLLTDTTFVTHPAPPPSVQPPPQSISTSKHPDRWSGSAWLLWRTDGSTSTLATQGRLGGSQAGLRVDHAWPTKSTGTFMAYSRLSAALEVPHSGEAAAGFGWRPQPVSPLSISVERRVRVSRGGRNAFALIAAAGIGPHDLGSGFDLEGYAQGGMVGFASHDGFADGRISLSRRLVAGSLNGGLSLSGGVQPGLSRVDLGPVLDIALPLSPGNAHLRVEWRERVAGNAAPGSGLAVTLSSYF